MRKRYDHCVRLPLTLLCCLLINACTSIPETRYYTLVANTDAQALINTRPSWLNNQDSIGIGPIVIPNNLENVSVVSTEDNNRLLINPYQLWAGNLKANINQVLADNLSTLLNIDGVWAFPWDNRNRPVQQVRIVFERFVGVRGQSVTLQAKWTLLNEYGKNEKQTTKTLITKNLASDSYLDYVQALNQALDELSVLIAQGLIDANKR